MAKMTQFEQLALYERDAMPGKARPLPERWFECPHCHQIHSFHEDCEGEPVKVKRHK